MPVIENDVFKLVSFRGPGEGSLDPTDGTDDGDVVTILRTTPVNPARPSPDVVRRLPDAALLGTDALRSLTTFRLAERLPSRRDLTIDDLARLAGTDPGFTDRALLQAEYSRLVSSWLVGKVKAPAFPAAEHERLIRVSRLWRQFQTNPETLRSPAVIARMLAARVVFPRALRTPRLRSNDDRRTASPSLETLRARYVKLVDDISRNEAIQRKAFGLYWETEARLSASRPANAATPGRSGGFLSRLADALVGRPIGARTPSAPALVLDDTFYTTLNNRLSAVERSRLDDLLGSSPSGTRPGTLHGLLGDVLATDNLLVVANDTCAHIRVLEEEQRTNLPPPLPLEPGAERPSVRAIGWGDLIVARERLVGYDADEIAHIENVLPGEKKLREHERKRKTEQVTETETITEEESERDLQTTDRHEMQNEVSSVIQETFSVEAGVNTSGRYGLTKVDTSL